jgi:hypothetical protein
METSIALFFVVTLLGPAPHPSHTETSACLEFACHLQARHVGGNWATQCTGTCVEGDTCAQGMAVTGAGVQIWCDCCWTAPDEPDCFTPYAAQCDPLGLIEPNGQLVIDCDRPSGCGDSCDPGLPPGQVNTWTDVCRCP